jgi:hypothetical protein
MTTTPDDPTIALPDRPPVVDLATWQAARDELLVREKAHNPRGRRPRRGPPPAADGGGGSWRTRDARAGNRRTHRELPAGHAAGRPMGAPTTTPSSPQGSGNTSHQSPPTWPSPDT